VNMNVFYLKKHLYSRAPLETCFLKKFSMARCARSNFGWIV
jgi:hypothetical protein